MLNQDYIDQVFLLLAAACPEPAIELTYINPYTLSVAVILSAQATDKGVNAISPALFAVADTPTKMLNLGIERLKQCIKSLGLYNNKAKNIIAMSEMLVRKFNSTIPSTFEELTSLPGIGPKSANVILNCVFHKPTIAVDTHVFRTANRIGLVKAKNVKETEKQLLARIPQKWLSHAHHWLVLHGRYVCKARKPQCQSCILKGVCLYYQVNNE